MFSISFVLISISDVNTTFSGCVTVVSAIVKLWMKACVGPARTRSVITASEINIAKTLFLRCFLMYFWCLGAI